MPFESRNFHTHVIRFTYTFQKRLCVEIVRSFAVEELKLPCVRSSGESAVRSSHVEIHLMFGLSGLDLWVCCNGDRLLTMATAPPVDRAPCTATPSSLERHGHYNLLRPRDEIQGSSFYPHRLAPGS
jgi:hypothetical protein